MTRTDHAGRRRAARPTLVADQMFAVAIQTDTDAARIDWRVDYDALTYTPIDPPIQIATDSKAPLTGTRGTDHRAPARGSGRYPERG